MTSKHTVTAFVFAALLASAIAAASAASFDLRDIGVETRRFVIN